MKKTLALILGLLLTAALCVPVSAATLSGDANVDGRFYPETAPFVHPPFYNVKVTVETDADNKVVSVSDNGTGLEGSVATKDMEAKWVKKNKPFFDAAVAAGVLTRFDGKTRDEIAAMDFTTGGADAVSGATLVGLATQEAVLNALDGKMGKTFLPVEGAALEAAPVENGVITFTSKLPADFELQLLDVRYGAANADVLDAAAYTFEKTEGGAVLTFSDPSMLKAGKYFVNVVDASGKYRSPNFESGHGETDMAQAPRFVIEAKDVTVAQENGQIVVTGADMADYMKNLQHVSVLADGAEKAVEQDFVGHHGTVNKGFNLLTEAGMLNPAATIRNRETKTDDPIFEAGKTYTVTVAAYGYPELVFPYEAK